MRWEASTDTQQRLAFWIPYCVLIVTWSLTMLATAYITASDQMTARLRFENQVQQSQDSIAARLETYISMLRGVTGLFAANSDIDRDQFHAYVERLDLPRHYPGIQGIGFSKRVLPSEHGALVDAMRRQGILDFRIWPEYVRPEYHAIIYLEPTDRRNRAAIGYDMFSDPVRRAAMERARDTGQPAASGRVVLVQEIDEHKQAGFLIYVPIYRDNRQPASLTEKRADLIGFAYSPFRADDLLRGIFGSQTHPRIAFQLYDGTEPSSEYLLHQSRRAPDADTYQPSFTTTTTMTVAGRTWSLVYTTQPAFEQAGSGGLAPFVLLAGTLISVVLFVVTRAQVMARTEAEAAVRARDIFLSVASHELKTPLTSLLGNAQLLLRRALADGTLPQREQRSVRVIAEQARRLNQLITTLLDHSRIQAGRFSVNRKALDLVALVHQVIDESQTSLSEHTLTLEIPDEPLIVEGDALRLEQVLQNLISNAVKYSPRGGPILVQVEPQDGWVSIHVVDRGIGIPASSLPHLFEQFYRAPNADAQHISGMGIGLYLTREIVTRHGGTIAVDSIEGQGCTFSVRLPLASPSGDLRQPTPAHVHEQTQNELA